MRFFLLLCGFLLAIAPPVAAAEQSNAAPGPTLAVRGGTHPDFDRIVIDWPRHVDYVVHRDAGHVVVDFSAAGQANWRQVTIAQLTRAGGFASLSGQDGHMVISFAVNPAAKVKDFLSGNSVVIDIAGAAVGPVAEKAEREQAAPKKDQASLPAPPPEKRAPAVATPPAPVAALPTVPKPDLEEAAKRPAPQPVMAAGPSQAPPPPPPVSDDLASKRDKTNPQLAPSPQAAPLAAVTAAAQPSAPAQPVQPSAKPTAFPDIGDTPLLIASLDPHVALRLAVYQRAGFGYIIFDRKLSLTLETLEQGQPPPRVALETMDLAKASGFRVQLPPDTEIRAARLGNVWQVFVSRQQPDVPVSASLVAQPDFALGARYLLPLPDAPAPVTLTDPVVGDNLIIVPLEQNQAFSVARHMAEFDIVPAAQGLVVKPLTDRIVARNVTDGVEITAEGGLHLSNAIDTGASQESSQRAKAAAAGKSMFDFTLWRGKPDETFTQSRQRLQQTIVDVPDAERNRALLELARFYFAHGNGEEAAALLAYLVRLVPDLAAHADYRALDGASKIMGWRPEEGLKAFDTPLLNTQPEIELWQAVAQAEMRNWKVAEEQFFITEAMLNGYPEPFYSRFFILAIESALAENKDREAADWLDRLENGHHSDTIEPALEYLHGVLDAKSGHAQKAEQAWRDVASSNDQLYRVRAKMALVDLGVSTRSLTPAQAADQLEALRFAWRGDDLEMDILHRLGQFYVQAKNIKAGLNTLSRAIQLYPDSPLTPDVKKEMADIFRDVFLDDLGAQLSPLDALTLYQQYRNLMPQGADGIAVMRNLAERLVQIDLLDQAAGLLEDLVKTGLQGEQKSRVSARLAAIRLLDHEPDQAIAGLDLAKDINVPADLQAERSLLRARALSELKKYDDALALLNNNETEPAQLLRADINMHAQRWSDAARALLQLVGPPPTGGAALTPQQGDWLVNCAIAASMAGDNAGLDKIRADYGQAIASLPQNDTFRMLTEPDRTEQTRDIAAAQAKISDVDMFQGFLNAYRKTSAADGNAAPVPQKTSAP